MSRLTFFTVSVPSRHPAKLQAYDELNHRYRPEYVDPKLWELQLHAWSIMAGEDDNGRPIINPSVESLKWTIEKEVSFKKEFSRGLSVTMFKTTVQVPEPGEYDITLEINLKNGAKEKSTRKYRLRDFLIVSLGDSFASGEGNPDVPAVPSPDQKALCKATTPLLVIRNLKDSVRKFIKGLGDNVKDKIEEGIPLIGKIGVAGINNIENIHEFIQDTTRSLKDAVIDVLRDFEAVFVEGVKEFGNWIGIGSGGSTDNINIHAAGWQERFAHRSYRSGHSLAAKEVETESLYGADRITFLSFARSGSEIEDGLLGPRTIDPDLLGTDFLDAADIDGWTGNRGQIEEAKDTLQSRRIDALIITVSVNDLGFSSLTSDSILYEKGEKRKELMDATEKKIIKDLPKSFERLNTAVKTKLNPRKVFITEYPINVFKEIETQGACGVLGVKDGRPILGDGFFDLSTSDAKGMGKLGRELNGKIKEAANKFGWVFIDGLVAGFDGHGYCAGQPYFVSAEESCRDQGDFEGMLHPNASGHEVTRDCIAKVLRRELLAPEERWLQPVLHVMMR